MQRRFAIVIGLSLAFVAGLLLGLRMEFARAQTNDADAAPAAIIEADEALPPPAELAPFMTSLQVFSQKLGFAIDGANAPLADFYVMELKETAMGIIHESPVHEGLPIDQYIYTMLYPTFKPLTEAIADEDWPLARERYVGVINACNTCHVASQHPFLVMKPAEGDPPYNQQFATE